MLRPPASDFSLMPMLPPRSVMRIIRLCKLLRPAQFWASNDKPAIHDQVCLSVPREQSTVPPAACWTETTVHQPASPTAPSLQLRYVCVAIVGLTPQPTHILVRLTCFSYNRSRAALKIQIKRPAGSHRRSTHPWTALKYLQVGLFVTIPQV